MRTHSVLLGSFAVFALSACASSGITDSWVAPGAGPIRFTKTLVVAMHPVEAVRRIGEDRLVRRIGQGRAVASHTLLSLEELQDTEAARASLDGDGFDGAVMMRVVGQDQVLSYQPAMAYPAYYGQFWGLVGYVAPLYGPTVMQGGTTVYVETNVYSIVDEQLIWSGVTRSLDPMDINGTIDEIADAVGDELRSQGLLLQ